MRVLLVLTLLILAAAVNDVAAPGIDWRLLHVHSNLLRNVDPGDVVFREESDGGLPHIPLKEHDDRKRVPERIDDLLNGNHPLHRHIAIELCLDCRGGVVQHHPRPRIELP